jgi:hypothetical protein
MNINKYLRITILFATIIFIIYAESKNKGACGYAKSFFEQNINGVIIDKFVDASNHNNPTIIIFDNSVEKKLLLFHNNDAHVYSYLSVKDSIYKAAKSYELDIKRNGKITKMALNFGCSDALNTSKPSK